jgi:ankyrin repeat protein
LRNLLIALILTFASQAEANCGKLCDWKWWETATTIDIETELNAGAEVNAKARSGATPLHVAASTTKDPTNIQVLLNAGADLEARSNGRTPLYSAIKCKRPKCSGVVEVLIANGAEVEVRNEAGTTPIHFASILGKGDSIKSLIAAGANIMAKDMLENTPLHYAAQRSNPTSINILIKAGAEVNAPNEGGMLPLHYGGYGGPKAIETLLRAGADIKARDWSGCTILHSIAERETAIYALKLGADLSAKCNDGSTPLHFATRYFSDKGAGTIQVLLNAGVDLKTKDKHGKTAWDYARENEELKGTADYWALNDARYK